MVKRVIAIVMVKNEAANIKRVLSSCKNIVDGYFVLDTGSTDNTVDLVNSFFDEEKHGFCMSSSFEDFGTTRTKSFEYARKFTRSLGWPDEKTYGLLLDARHVVEDRGFDRDQLISAGYSCIRNYCGLQYPNLRFIRFDVDWRCVGVVHEYWTAKTGVFNELLDTIQIHDTLVNYDNSKIARYKELLELGLTREPNNPRYVFYMAQTLRELGKKDEAIAMYKRRMKMGGYSKEVWYSMYQLSRIHVDMKDKIYWALQAYVFDNTRAEALYHAGVQLRWGGENRKAYSMMRIAFDIPKPTNDLFVETAVYDREIHKEMTILVCYSPSRMTHGYRLSLDYLNAHGYDDIVMRNLKWYTTTVMSSMPETEDVDPISISGGKAFSLAVAASKKFRVNDKIYMIVKIENYYSIVNETDRMWSRLVIGFPGENIQGLEWFPV